MDFSILIIILIFLLANLREYCTLNFPSTLCSAPLQEIADGEPPSLQQLPLQPFHLLHFSFSKKTLELAHSSTLEL
jgi:hypothetical protein